MLNSDSYTETWPQCVFKSLPTLQRLIVVTLWLWTFYLRRQWWWFRQILHVLLLPDSWPKVKLHTSFPHIQTGDPWPPLLSLSHVFSCLKWMLTAVSTHSQTASSKSSAAPPFFFHRNVCLSRKQEFESLRCSKRNKPNVNREAYKHYENDLNTSGSGIE